MKLSRIAFHLLFALALVVPFGCQSDSPTEPSSTTPAAPVTPVPVTTYTVTVTPSPGQITAGTGTGSTITVDVRRNDTGQPPADRRMFGTKRITVGKMYAQLAAMRALWWQAFMEAQGFPSKAQVMRMYAAQYNVMEGVQEIAALAIRTCGGQSMLKSLPLERMYRDSRCGALMLPYTSEIMEDYLSVLTLYDLDELDKAPGDEGGARSSLWRGTGGTLKGLR